ncbi:hypothetical protein AB0M02_38300 [Actinoplanes sp. NPDC051861]|uniref:hypothetical protein n=1 Tax=Actinoplanes sp. NPDC051861 TaxID=3155170 RepID=UPI00341517CD
MLVVALLGAAMVAAWTYALWPLSPPADVVESPPVTPLPRVESTEGLLVAQLFRGELTTPQYTRAMECLAARDEARHPVTVPGDGA